MTARTTCVFALCLWLCLAGRASAGVLDIAADQLELGTFGQGGEGRSATRLSQSEISQGLKAALAQGVRVAVNRLGAADGFLKSPEFRIPLPNDLAAAEKALRAVGQSRLADDVLVSINRAAEKAVPATADILLGAVRGLSVQDAAQILDGPKDAATRYFDRTSRGRLAELILPIVKQATESARVTAAYKRLMDKAGGAAALLGGTPDLDAYVAKGALDGLFRAMAAEEARIRENPAARGSAILRTVFGAKD